jgi:hypothetical protein
MLITVLEILAVVLALAGILIMIVIVIHFARSIIHSRPKVIEKMANDKDVAREGVTFNDIFMFMIAVPLVLLWVGFAGFVIHSGLNDASVLDQIEGYTTLIAILGGPALLIIKDALDVWKQEQAEKTAFYKQKAQAVIDYNDAAQKQAQMIEAKAQEHEHKKK